VLKSKIFIANQPKHEGCFLTAFFLAKMKTQLCQIRLVEDDFLHQFFSFFATATIYSETIAGM